MEISIETLYWILGVFNVFIVFGLALLFSFKFRFKHRQQQRLQLTQAIFTTHSGKGERSLTRLIEKSPKQVLKLLLEVGQTQQLEHDKRANIIRLLRETGIEKEYHRRLLSSSTRKRADAAVYLSALPCENSRHALLSALRKEKDIWVRLHFAAALTKLKHAAAIPDLLGTLPGAPQWYRTRLNMLLASFGRDCYEYLPPLFTKEEPEIKSFLIDFASVYPSEELKQYLLRMTGSDAKDLAYRATRVLGSFYYHELNKPAFINHKDAVIRNITLQALDKIQTKENLENLLPLLADPRSRESAATTISNILQAVPQHMPLFLHRFEVESDHELNLGLASVLCNRIDYLLLRLKTDQSASSRQLICKIIRLGKLNGIIGFLNKNRTIELENEILELLRPIMASDDSLRQELRLYLAPRMLEKLKEPPLTHEKQSHVPGDAQEKLFRLYLLLFAAFGAAPVIYLLRHWHEFLAWTPRQNLEQFVIDFNYYIAYYSLTVNFSYLLLLAASFLAVIRQAKHWRLKTSSFLFRPRILPSVSIIAPAFNEEATIIENANSLLSLHYPNYEVIIVNDGSSDGTLSLLIRHFQLDKVEIYVPNRLQTKPIRGIYANKHLPKLLVVDKANGGKADALNAGINLSRKEFFCGIDADSLLEKDTLTKLAALVIDAPAEPVAIGGNIFPVNGCTVDKGMLTSIHIPSSHLARFQTIEYLRAFMAGRLGWSYFNSLLIISGALGLFSKDRVVEIGGYLASSERYKKDTVGEDMELVVRLRRHMQEKKLPHSILYAYNANCWTEVPENFSSLYRQRDRWQRGLIDILFFHRRMLMNPAYGKIGLVAMPYFFFFEMYGPFIELQGYLMVITAYALGLLNPFIALLLFIATIQLGTMVSIYSLVITEKEHDYFPGPYMSTMLLYALIENFGVRQLISAWRVSGFFSALRQTRTWGKMTRQGFQQDKTSNINKPNDPKYT